MNKKNENIFYRISTFSPCLFEIFIFQCFRFADWKNDLDSEIQTRILFGSLAIAVFFALYYIIFFIWVKKFYIGGDKTIQLLKTGLFAMLGFMSYIIGYFL